MKLNTNDGEKFSFAFLTLLMILIAGTGNAQFSADTIAVRKKFSVKYEPGIEGIFPINPARRLYTVTTNQLVGMEFARKYLCVSVYFGLTLTYSAGHINDYNFYGQWVAFRSNAFGTGPVTLFRFEPPVNIKNFSISVDIGAGIILYSRRFPAGADIYDFMVRIGASVAYHFDKKNAVRVDGKWMHVSNGQSLGRNPMYEGTGFSIEYVRYLK